VLFFGAGCCLGTSGATGPTRSHFSTKIAVALFSLLPVLEAYNNDDWNISYSVGHGMGEGVISINIAIDIFFLCLR